MNTISPAPLVLPLRHAAATPEVAGGKGASLARLAGAGLPVPDGFHVTTEAYRRFVAEYGLQQEIAAALAPVMLEQPETLDSAALHIARLFAEQVMPAPLAEAIRRAYARLGGVAVAVRSSATAEDLPEASFAGQMETYLNICGEAEVLEAVQRCWASLWTARAIAYRARQGIAPAAVSLAVVVQAMVPAEVAGMLFTAHPLTGARDQVVIDAAWGLGEAIVGGRVTPDTVVVEKIGGKILEEDISIKA